MGTCTSKEDQAATNKPVHIRVPDFDYLNRAKKLICHVTPESVEKHQFKSKIKIRADSTVGYLSNDRMMVVGGSDSSGYSTNNACIIDNKNKSATIIARLPISAKEGALLEYNEWVFYVGAVIEDEESILGVSGAPVMRYNLNENYWEVFIHEEKKKKSRHHEDEPNPNIKEFRLKDLLYPGCFIIHSKIYFVGGQRINSKGKLRSSKKMFSLDCKNLKVKKEDIRLPIKVIKPVCASGSGHAIIAGGENPKTKKHSQYCYLFSLDPQPDFKLMEVIGFSLTEEYPAIYIPGRGPIFINYPGAAFKDKHAANWHRLDIAKIANDDDNQIISHHKYTVEKATSSEDPHETYMKMSVEVEKSEKKQKKVETKQIDTKIEVGKENGKKGALEEPEAEAEVNAGKKGGKMKVQFEENSEVKVSKRKKKIEVEVEQEIIENNEEEERVEKKKKKRKHHSKGSSDENNAAVEVDAEIPGLKAGKAPVFKAEVKVSKKKKHSED
ncbi:unnamed protein product [Blepharisma stoltei]|uniref:Uncharacterized protein n=1 Tax=Blepharisma stoltei TaxID=1481888 RepID=A0AAU9IHN2_9CILI|nr:unnamed protein product [Blepharisma stoltei]